MTLSLDMDSKGQNCKPGFFQLFPYQQVYTLNGMGLPGTNFTSGVRFLLGVRSGCMTDDVAFARSGYGQDCQPALVKS